VFDGGAFVEHDAAGVLELLDYGAGGVSGCFHNANARVDDGGGVGWIVWRIYGGEEGEVDAEGEGGHGLASGDFGPQGVGGGLGETCELWISLVSGI